MRGNLDISTDAPSTATFEDHSARHENGGADEISVTGLSGLLADAQTPLAHATSHQNNGTDEIDVTGLSGLLADPQTPIPAGNDTEVQFKDGTAQAGDSGLTYNKTTDKLTVGGGLTADGDTFNVDATNDRVGIGTASPEERLHIVGNGTDSTIVRTENSGVPNGVAFDQYSNSGTQTNSFFGRKLRGSKASPLRTKSGDALIRVGGSGGHAADDVTTATLLNAFRARIELLAAEDWTSTAQGTDIVLSTTPLGSTTLTEQLRLSASGLLTLIAGQIKFPATQNASADPNTLDDYEETDWTPTFTFATPGDLAVTYGIQVGICTKFARVAICTFSLTTTAFTHTTAAGALTIGGLPFSVLSALSQRAGAASFQGITKAGYTSFVFNALAGTTTALLEASGSGVGRASVTAADMPSGGAVNLIGALLYVVD